MEGQCIDLPYLHVYLFVLMFACEQRSECMCLRLSERQTENERE